MPLHQDELWIHRAGGYFVYRIPALVTTTAGTVLAFCEGRRHTGADHDEIDILVRRSFDGGLTWDPPRVAVTDGSHTCGNPCPIVDETTGVVWLLFCRRQPGRVLHVQRRRRRRLVRAAGDHRHHQGSHLGLRRHGPLPRHPAGRRPAAGAVLVRRVPRSRALAPPALVGRGPVVVRHLQRRPRTELDTGRDADAGRLGRVRRGGDGGRRRLPERPQPRRPISARPRLEPRRRPHLERRGVRPRTARALLPGQPGAAVEGGRRGGTEPGVTGTSLRPGAAPPAHPAPELRRVPELAGGPGDHRGPRGLLRSGGGPRRDDPLPLRGGAGTGAGAAGAGLAYRRGTRGQVARRYNSGIRC